MDMKEAAKLLLEKHPYSNVCYIQNFKENYILIVARKEDLKDFVLESGEKWHGFSVVIEQVPALKSTMAYPSMARSRLSAMAMLFPSSQMWDRKIFLEDFMEKEFGEAPKEVLERAMEIVLCDDMYFYFEEVLRAICWAKNIDDLQRKLAYLEYDIKEKRFLGFEK